MIQPEFVIGNEKNEVFRSVKEYLKSKSFRIASSTLDKPWGGFYVVNEQDTKKFAQYFFPDDAQDMLDTGNKLSPKILVVAPSMRLSWQYHFRRAEIWKLIAGVAGIVTSNTDVEMAQREIILGEVVRLKVGQRHRLVGLKSGWGAVAEIWQHTDPKNPSDENDIVRVQDDFNRK